MTNFADRLITAVQNKQNPCVVGLDFHAARLPAFVSDALKANPTPEGYRTAVSDYLRRILDAVAPLVPAVKPQVSLLERLTWVGAQILTDITDHARNLGLLVIADAKRGDIASSALGYAQAFLDPTDGPSFARGYDVDCLTVNPFLGRDTLKPYVDACASAGKGIFVLVKTSNPGSGETQDALLQESNHPAYTAYAHMVNDLGQSTIGSRGYSSIGAVVGATYPHQAEELRSLMPTAIILVPGYGAQGGTADDAVRCFNPDGLGAVVNASRSITCAFDNPDISPADYAANVRHQTLRMIDDINSALAHRHS